VQLVARQRAQALGALRGAAAVEPRFDALGDDPDETVDVVHDATLTNNK
jgi:hypothetical protein